MAAGDAGTIVNLPCSQGNRVRPVSTRTGNFWHTFDDIAIPGRGIPLSFSRTYNSAAASSDGPLGFGWTFNYNMRLVITSSGVTVHQEDASKVNFTLSGGSYEGPARAAATLVKKANGTYVFTRRSQQIFRFDSAGRLTEIEDLNGYSTTLTRPNATTLVATDSAGRTLTLAFTGSRLTSVTDTASPPRVVRFQYLDGQGNLTDVIDVNGGHTTFGYDAAHRMTTWREPKFFGDVTTVPAPETTNHYDTAGRVDWQSDPLGRKTSFFYDDPDSGATRVVDPRGNQTVDRYRDGLLIAQTVGYGTPQAATWSRTYDPVSIGCASVREPTGQTTWATYDALGNRLSVTDPLGRTTRYTYSANNLLTSVTNPMGVTTTYTYDSAGCACNLVSRSRPLLNANGTVAATQTTTYNYGENGNTNPGEVTSMVDPNSKRWAYTYSTNGDLTTITDPLQHETSATYDGVGRKLTEVSPRGNVAGADPTDFTTTFSYTNDNLVAKVKDPLWSAADPTKHQTVRKYDLNRNLKSITDANGHKTAFTYDPADQLTVITRADGSDLQQFYWPDGRLKSQWDGADQVTRYDYDSRGRLISRTDPLSRTTAYGYAFMGNRQTVTQTAAGGGTTTWTYGITGQLESVDYSDVTPDVTAITYDANGRRTAMTDGTGTSTWTWDSLDRLTASRTGDSIAYGAKTLGYGYDLAGHLTTIAYPGIATPVVRRFDDAGRMDAVTDWLGNTTTFDYDEDDNLTKRIFPAASGLKDEMTYDRVGRLKKITDTRAGSVYASFDYDLGPAGLVDAVVSTGVPTEANTYGYSSLDQLTTVNAATTYGYDAADNLVRNTTATQAFDVANQLCWSAPTPGTCASPPAGATRYSFDARGNRTAATPPSGPALSYSYDQANRLVTAPGTRYHYNGDGLRMAKEDTAVGQIVAGATWNLAEGLPLLVSEDGPAGTTRYVHGPDGLPLERVSTTGAVLFYHPDRLGSTRVLTDTAGNVAATYTFDAYGRPAGSTGSVSQPFGFAGQYTDAETGFVYLRARYYDPATGQFLTRDPLEAVTREAYGYVGGNPLNATDPSGLWSFRPRPDNRQPVPGVSPTPNTPTSSDRAPGTREDEDRGSGQPPPNITDALVLLGVGETLTLTGHAREACEKDWRCHALLTTIDVTALGLGACYFYNRLGSDPNKRCPPERKKREEACPPRGDGRERRSGALSA